MKKLTLVAFVAALALTACGEISNSIPHYGGGWSGGESTERSRERSGETNPGETTGSTGTTDTGGSAGFGSSSG